MKNKKINKRNKQEELNKAIRQLEDMKKKSFSTGELRSRNKLINRLDRMQERDFSKRLSIEQNKLREPSFINKFLNEKEEETQDIFSFLHIPKKRIVQKNRGGFWWF